MLNVKVMSRDDAIKYCQCQHDTPTVMISISDPYIQYFEYPFCDDRNKVLAIQRVYFMDADKPGKDVYGRSVEESDLITDGDAFLIKRLLKKFPDTDIIVHCDAGISRSSGVAAAILKTYTGDDSQIFDSPRYRPNMRCYRLVLNELMRADFTWGESDA